MSFRPPVRQPVDTTDETEEPAVPKRETAPVGHPCWIEIGTSDIERTRAFYGELFGWTSESAGDEYGGYVRFLKDGVQVAGCMSLPEGAPDAWLVYLAVTDARATVDAAGARGSEVFVPAMGVMDLGTMAV